MGRRFCHWWQEVGGRRITAMVTAIIVLLVVAALVTLSIVRPSSSLLTPAPADRDRDRTLTELRGLHDYHSDVRLP
jgi:hypothetical protein